MMMTNNCMIDCGRVQNHQTSLFAKIKKIGYNPPPSFKVFVDG